ncbi:hypothetical protein WA026_006183 [Henosepilachna vigintioctopunctata]|uniref:Uncharacterized protein n=1 Tax=Henosepilachna vigintioctopunctata TaxID=420089 RepID=A0AAW1TSG2_9CUCU
MNEKTLNIFIFQLAILGLTEGIFHVQVNLPGCTYKCDNPKKEDNNSDKKIKDFYWRDFYGVVPPDAYQLGDNNQNPQTYVGMVFDPSHNGTFITTIVEGQDYVYGVVGNEVSKLTDTIQILCTMEPEKVTWTQLYNVDQLEGYYVVRGYFHYERKNDSQTLEYFRHYVVKTTEGNMAYAGYSTGLNTSITYALSNGTPRNTQNFEWLLFSKEAKENEKSSTKPFLSYNYNFSLSSALFQSKFHHQINIGSCSLVCTNQGKGSTDKDKMIKKKSESAMVYYWKPSYIEDRDRENLLEVGRSFSDNPSYIGQGLTTNNWYDVGQTEGGGVYLVRDKYAEVQAEFQVSS